MVGKPFKSPTFIASIYQNNSPNSINQRTQTQIHLLNDIEEYLNTYHLSPSIIIMGDFNETYAKMVEKAKNRH